MAQLTAHDGLMPLIPLTIPEVRRLLVRVLAPPEAVLHWSRWRQLHQARAMRSHYSRHLRRRLK